MKLYYISTIIANYFRDYYPSLVKFSRKIQKFLWYIGIAIYNPIADEDTPDFNSNADYKNSRFCFIRKQKKIIDSYWIDFTDYRIYKEYTDKYAKDLYEALIKSQKIDSRTEIALKNFKVFKRKINIIVEEQKAILDELNDIEVI